MSEAPNTSWFRQSYGRLLISGTDAGDSPEDRELTEAQIESVLRRGLVSTIHTARRVAANRLKDPVEVPLPSAVDHPHSPTGCLTCACAPYVGGGRKHAVEMSVLHSILVDQRKQTEPRTSGVPAHRLRDRMLSYDIEAEHLEDMLGPNWTSVMLLAYTVEETRPSALIRAADGADIASASHGSSGRDYSHAAKHLIRRAAVPPHEVEPSLLDRVPEAHRGLVVARGRSDMARIIRHWEPIAVATAAGAAMSSWGRRLLGHSAA